MLLHVHSCAADSLTETCSRARGPPARPVPESSLSRTHGPFSTRFEPQLLTSRAASPRPQRPNPPFPTSPFPPAHEPKATVPPLPVREPHNGRVGLLEVFLALFPPVEYGAVPRGAQDVLVEGPLAPLALRPQLGEGVLEVVHLFLNRC